MFDAGFAGRPKIPPLAGAVVVCEKNLDGAGVVVGVVDCSLLPNLPGLDGAAASPMADAKPLPNMDVPPEDVSLDPSSALSLGSGWKLEVSLNGWEPNGFDATAGLELGGGNDVVLLVSIEVSAGLLEPKMLFPLFAPPLLRAPNAPLFAKLANPPDVLDVPAVLPNGAAGLALANPDCPKAGVLAAVDAAAHGEALAPIPDC